MFYQHLFLFVEGVVLFYGFGIERTYINLCIPVTKQVINDTRSHGGAKTKICLLELYHGSVGLNCVPHILSQSHVRVRLSIYCICYHYCLYKLSEKTPHHQLNNIPELSCLRFSGIVTICCLGECVIKPLHIRGQFFPTQVRKIQQGIFHIFRFTLYHKLPSNRCVQFNFMNLEGLIFPGE